jgi:hypothetical protein
MDMAPCCLTTAYKVWSAMVPVNGTVVEVAPVVLDTHDTSYESVVIRKEDGTFQEFEDLHAIPELSGFVQPKASGMFLFLNRPKGWRLAFFYSDDGPRAVDFDAMREYLEQAG